MQPLEGSGDEMLAAMEDAQLEVLTGQLDELSGQLDDLATPEPGSLAWLSVLQPATRTLRLKSSTVGQYSTIRETSRLPYGSAQVDGFSLFVAGQIMMPSHGSWYDIHTVVYYNYIVAASLIFGL